MSETTERAAPRAAATPLDEMHDFLAQFVAATPAQLTALALWVGHAHVLDAFQATPRLLITSDAPGCGKSEALRRVGDLVPRGWSAGRATKAAVTARLNCAPDAKPTLFIDEVSQVFGKAGHSGATHPLYGVLCEGYKHGAREAFATGRTAVEVDIYTAVAMAGRGNAVPDDVVTRSIRIRMQPGTPATDYTLREHDPQSAMYRAAVGRMLRSRIGHIAAYSAKGIHPKMTGRTREIWEPLLAVADAAGGDWPARCLDAFSDLVMDRGASVILTPHEMVLRDMLRAAEEIGTEEIAGLDIIARLRDYGEPLYDISRPALAMLMSKAMEPVRPVQLSRTAGEGRQQRGYYLADIREMAAARLPAEPDDTEPASDTPEDDEPTIFG
jgi:hypothetical protein